MTVAQWRFRNGTRLLFRTERGQAMHELLSGSFQAWADKQLASLLLAVAGLDEDLAAG